jgi:hypothetical protein
MPRPLISSLLKGPLANPLYDTPIGPTSYPIGGVFGQGGGGGGASGPTYSPAESAIILPQSAIWISQQGVTQAGTVSAWASYLGGVSSTLTQGTGAAQPAYNASGGVGGLPLITFDGTDDVLTAAITKGSAWSSYEWGIVGQRVAFGTAGDVWAGYGTAAGVMRFSLQDQTAALFRGTVIGGANVSGTTDPDAFPAHYSCGAGGGLITVRVGGVIEGGPTAATVTSRADGENVCLGASPTGATAANVAMQAAYIGPELTADQRTYLRGALTFWTSISS